VDFTTNRLAITYDPTKYGSHPNTDNPQVLIFYKDGETSKKIGIRLPSTTTPTVQFAWQSTQNVAESLTATTVWQLAMDSTGKVTVLSPKDVEFQQKFTELRGDISTVKIGFNGFDQKTTNCYRIFNTKAIKVGK
jgi:hypothetical protein